MSRLTDLVAAVQADALYYNGDIAPKAKEAYVILNTPSPVATSFLMIEVQYHSKGYSAIYEINLTNNKITVAQD